MCGPFLAPGSAFTSEIGHVISVGTEPEMVRPYAARNIAAMQYASVWWYGAARKLPGHAMRKTFVLAVHSEPAVVAHHLAASPEPAITDLGTVRRRRSCFVNARPEALLDCSGATLALNHVDHPPEMMRRGESRLGLHAQPARASYHGLHVAAERRRKDRLWAHSSV